MSRQPEDPPPQSASGAAPFVPFANRLDGSWSPYWIRRTLTDEPGPGMGSPFSNDDAELFLRVSGLARPQLDSTLLSSDDNVLLERMWFWLDTHRG